MLSLYSGLMLTIDTRDARKESIRFVFALPGSWFLCSASLKKRSYPNYLRYSYLELYRHSIGLQVLRIEEHTIYEGLRGVALSAKTRYV